MIAASLVSSTALAHQQKAAETTVLFNQRSNQLEVMHRFYLHDTEHAVQSLFDKSADILDSQKTQQQFADYVAKQFLARSLADEPLTLNSVGYEVEEVLTGRDEIYVNELNIYIYNFMVMKNKFYLFIF